MSHFKMISTVALPRLRRALRRFAGDRRGLSAVEFATELPFMLTLYAGSVEFGESLSIDYKPTLAARTVADIASQYTSIDGPKMTSILGAASTVVAPYPAADMTVVVSEVTTDANGNGTITWSAALNGNAHKVGQAVTLPTDLRIPSISLLWDEVTYPYTPSLGYVVTGTISMYQSEYFYPRLSNCVSFGGGLLTRRRIAI
jgi:Flp pilus assembly protein TadG